MDLRLPLTATRTALALLLATPLAALTLNQATLHADGDALWRATLAGNPRCWTAYEHLAQSLQQQGRTREAEAQYEAALAINPDSVDALTNLGQLELDADPPQLQQATLHLQRAIAVNPKAAAAHSNLGLVWLRQDRLEEAVAEQQMALAIRPDFGDVRCHLTVTFEALRRTDDAVAEGRACHDQAPEIAQQIAAFHQAQATRLLEAGQVPIALGEYRQALRVSPTSPDLLNAYGALLLSQGNQREAAVVLSEAIRLRPDFAAARTNLQLARAALNGDR